MSEEERDFNLFLEGLKKAATKIDEQHYFRLPVATKKDDEKVFRERVYCYELYHQLRLALGDVFPYKLHGEVDKIGHEIVPGEKKPDFIVHDPGSMTNNLVVIEVKPAKAKNIMLGLKKDLETLQIFLGERGQYYRGIMLVYGDGQSLRERIKSRVATFSKTCDNRIVLVWHSGPGAQAEIVSFDM